MKLHGPATVCSHAAANTSANSTDPAAAQGFVRIDMPRTPPTPPRGRPKVWVQTLVVSGIAERPPWGRIPPATVVVDISAMPMMIAVTVPVAMTDVANVDVDVTMPVTMFMPVTVVAMSMPAMLTVALGELEHVRRVPHLWERGSDRKRLAGHHSGCPGRKADQCSESNLSEHGTFLH